MRSRLSRIAVTVALSVSVAVITACNDTSSVPSAPITLGAPSAARASSGPSVTATSPSYGHRGESNKPVTITGSGFSAGATVEWDRGGIVDPKIAVISATVVSSKQISAVITIAADADLSLYDVVVTNADRKKGVGTEMFEVTAATSLSGTESVYAVNSNGEMAGRVGVPGAFYYSTASGLVTLGSPGRAYAISNDGLTVAGGTTNNAPNAQAYLYINFGGAWQRVTLPKDAASCIATARAIGSDGNGAAVFVGGVENGGCYSRNNLHRQPRIWVPAGGNWDKKVLPGGANMDDLLDDVNGLGIAVGTSSNRAAVWTPNGAGSWTLAQIGVTGSALHGINASGTIAVGELNGVAEYWTSNGVSWSGPFALPGSCASAVSVDDAGDILANGCANGNRRTPGVIRPPYGSGGVTLLGGLGASGQSVTAERISPSGGWVVGEVTVQGTSGGVYWKIF
ncbi:MAG: hypothetical protein ABIW94_12905 [Gemmatimonadaceae bacterium]